MGGLLTNVANNYAAYQQAKTAKREAELLAKARAAYFTAYIDKDPGLAETDRANAVQELADTWTKLQHPEIGKQHRGMASRILHGIGGGILGGIGGGIMAGQPNLYQSLPTSLSPAGGAGPTQSLRATPSTLAPPPPGLLLGQQIAQNAMTGPGTMPPELDPATQSAMDQGLVPKPEYTEGAGYQNIFGQAPGPLSQVQMQGMDPSTLAAIRARLATTGATPTQLAGTSGQPTPQSVMQQAQALQGGGGKISPLPQNINIPQTGGLPDISQVRAPPVQGLPQTTLPPLGSVQPAPYSMPSLMAQQSGGAAARQAGVAPSAGQQPGVDAYGLPKRTDQYGFRERPSPEEVANIPPAWSSALGGAPQSRAAPGGGQGQLMPSAPTAPSTPSRPGGPTQMPPPPSVLPSILAGGGTMPQAAAQIAQPSGGGPGGYPISPQAQSNWARMSMLYAGPQGQAAFQLQQIMDDMQRRGIPKDQQDVILQAMTGGRASSTTRAGLEERVVDDALAAKQAQLGRPLLPEETYATEQQAMAQLASRTRATGLQEQGLQNYLEVGARKLNKTVDQLTPEEWNKIYNQFVAKQDPNAPVYDPDEAARQLAGLAPGQKNEEILRGVDQQIANTVKALDNYQIPWPSSFALTRTPFKEALPLLEGYDPTWNESNYQVRYQTKRDYAPGGKVGQNLLRMNTTVEHLDSMSKNGAALGNLQSGTWGPATRTLNTIGRIWRENQQDPRLKAFIRDVNAVTGDLAGVFKGAASPSTTEIEHWRDSVDAASSPEEIQAAVAEGARLMLSRLNEAQEAWEDTFPGDQTQLSRRFISQDNVARLRRLAPGIVIPGIDTAPQGMATPAMPATRGAPGAGPAPDGVFNPQTGQIEPVRPQQ